MDDVSHPRHFGQRFRLELTGGKNACCDSACTIAHQCKPCPIGGMGKLGLPHHLEHGLSQAFGFGRFRIGAECSQVEVVSSLALSLSTAQCVTSKLRLPA